MFVKDILKLSEEKSVEMILDSREFTYYDMERQEFMVEACEDEIEMGASSRGICLCKSIII